MAPGVTGKFGTVPSIPNFYRRVRVWLQEIRYLRVLSRVSTEFLLEQGIEVWLGAGYHDYAGVEAGVLLDEADHHVGAGTEVEFIAAGGEFMSVDGEGGMIGGDDTVEEHGIPLVLGRRGGGVAALGMEEGDQYLGGLGQRELEASAGLWDADAGEIRKLRSDGGEQPQRLSV